ncbi:hypothetical protein B0T17DRAFT_629600 [Bombardia bombarda]|uniref:Uncharacterized protein n=1 Tax=Bombardia bombarda TaxID=252184 RepID=A0AA39TGJ1_9PEZI|nr:hypothetical protein B0T17DRAFT_629600 [Bombardia bombarda]
MLIAMPNRRQLFTVLAFVVTFLMTLALLQHTHSIPAIKEALRPKPKPDPEPPASTHHPKHKQPPKYTPPPIKDNFPLLATSTSPPPIPSWNIPRPNLHKEHNLPVPPPLLIGFTRTWPLLQQSVVSYITAGWPADQIYIIENTGVQMANARGQLTLQNPFFLNHTVLRTLGVNIIQTPTLLNFAQLQNFYLSLSYAHDWPYYFWSHMDVLALSYEDGLDGVTPRYDEPGYKALYELAVTALAEARRSDPRWGLRFFAYDHLALVNPVAYEDVGGWDTLIPYYITDCDMHSRLTMRNWSLKDAKAGIITDVSVALDDLGALYRAEGVVPRFTDPNPPEEGAPSRRTRRNVNNNTPSSQLSAREPGITPRDGTAEHDLGKWRALLHTADGMFHYKVSNKGGRNTWQTGQRGGYWEPYHYDAAGFQEALEIITEAGKEVYRHKWGHRDCDLIEGGGLTFEDQWGVERDW